MMSKKAVWIIVILLIIAVLVFGFRNWSERVSDEGQGTSGSSTVEQELSSTIEGFLLNEETDDISLEDVSE